VLLMVAILSCNAYGISVLKEIESQTERKSILAMYILR
jgi:hypothetical protein